MSITALNKAFAAKLKLKMLELPSVALKSNAMTVLEGALMKTIQDSGEAAYNWNIAWDGQAQVPYLNVKGVHPVGEPFEKRGAGDAMVIHDVIAEEKANVPSDGEIVHKATVYNPIEDIAHERAADLEVAGTQAADPEELNSTAGKKVNAYFLRSH